MSTAINPSDSRTAPAIAIVMIMASGGVLAGMDVTAKYLALELPVLLVLWGRYFFHTVITFAVYAGKRRSLSFLRARRPGFQFGPTASPRNSAEINVTITGAVNWIAAASPSGIRVIATYMNEVAPNSDAVGPRRMFAVVVAFAGVLLVARPGSDVLGWAALLPLATAVLLAIYMVMTRMIRETDNPDSTTFYTTAVGALVLTAVVPFYWQALTPFEWMLMVTMGSAGAIGHFLLVKAFHAAEASMLAPFTYSQVVAAIAWGFVVFADVPSLWTAAGATLIIGSGIYVWYRENVRRGRAA